MLVRNENFEQINLNDLVDQVLTEYNADPTVDVTEEEAQAALASLYYESNVTANKALFHAAAYTMPQAGVETRKPRFIQRIWNDFQNEVCDKFDDETEQDKIASVVAEAISSLVVWKVLVKYALKIVLFFVLKHGHTLVCKNRVFAAV